MLTVGDRLPSFDLPAVAGWDEPRFTRVRSADLAGAWLVLFTWPMDFTSVCPTEIAAFSRKAADFRGLGAAVVGASVDSEHAHRAWRRMHPHLRHVEVPMMADVGRVLLGPLGVIDHRHHVALRSTFIVDPTGVIRHVSVHDLATGRSVDEVLRTLAALQANGPTPCGWQPGDELAEDVAPVTGEAATPDAQAATPDTRATPDTQPATSDEWAVGTSTVEDLTTAATAAAGRGGDTCATSGERTTAVER
jgi:peroxiredoxin (alkyl hydroperoxide reductase subunit C)